MSQRPEPSLAIVAMGGHAFLQKGEEGTVEQQWRNAERIAELVLILCERGHDLVITHGNGPQVGDLMRQQELALGQVAAMPMDVLVAMTEGSLGYILQQSLLNQMRDREVERWVVTMVTQVLVDEGDPAFQRPNKPVGSVLTPDEARQMRDALGWNVQEDPGRGWRRYVPSPDPRKVLQHRMIREVAQAGHIVVAGGGGGIPICRSPEGRYRGVEAVVDKDLTSSVLATDIGADLLIILTAVPQVYLHFGTPEQRALGAVTLEEIEALQAEGHFPKGSMGPKVEAVIRYLRNGGKRALITDPESLPRALEGRAGTHFVGQL